MHGTHSSSVSAAATSWPVSTISPGQERPNPSANISSASDSEMPDIDKDFFQVLPSDCVTASDRW